MRDTPTGLLVQEFGAVSAASRQPLAVQGWRRAARATGSYEAMLIEASEYDRQGLAVGFAIVADGPVARYQLYTKTRTQLSQSAFIDYVREHPTRVSYRRFDATGPGLFIADDQRVVLAPNRVTWFLTEKLNSVMSAAEHGRLSRAVWVEQGIVEGCFSGPNPYR